MMIIAIMVIMTIIIKIKSIMTPVIAPHGLSYMECTDVGRY